MIVARNIRCSSYDRDSIIIGWEYADTVEELSDYTVAVLRSESAEGDYEAVSDELDAGEVASFTDESVNLLSKIRPYHYRVRLTKGEDSQVYGSTPHEKVLSEDAAVGGVVLEALPDLIAVEAQRRFELTLREFIGRRVLTLVQRTFGTYCTTCWDKLKGRRTTSNCRTCYGGGYTGGYYQPIETFAAKMPTALVAQLTPILELQPHDAMMWFSVRTRLKPRDLVIDTEGMRWRVLTVQRSEKLWALTRQTVQLRALSRDQVEYDIAVSAEDWGRDSLSASPRKNYLNATDLDSYYSESRERGVVETE